VLVVVVFKEEKDGRFILLWKMEAYFFHFSRSPLLVAHIMHLRAR